MVLEAVVMDEKDEEIFRLQQLQYAAEAQIEELEKKATKPKKRTQKAKRAIRVASDRIQSEPTIWVVAFPDGGCYAGKQIRRFSTEVEIELLDAVMLAGCGLTGEGSLTGELRRFPVEECRFFNDLQAMGTCVLRSCERHRASLTQV